MAVEDSPSCAHWSKKVASFQGCFSYRDAEARYQSMVTLRGAEAVASFGGELCQTDLAVKSLTVSVIVRFTGIAPLSLGLAWSFRILIRALDWWSIVYHELTR